MKTVGIAYSKHRNALGLVGNETIPAERKALVKFAREWQRENISKAPATIAKLYDKIKWDKTVIDQQVGEFFIQDLKNHGIPLQVITTQKDLKDPENIERIKVMDKVEMTHFIMVALRQRFQIEFPANPPKTIQKLEHQISMYTEHKTEAGGIDYYAPGDQKDNLTKAFMISIFAERNVLTKFENTVHVGGGIGTNEIREQIPSFDSGEFNSEIEKWWET